MGHENIQAHKVSNKLLTANIIIEGFANTYTIYINYILTNQKNEFTYFNTARELINPSEKMNVRLVIINTLKKNK